MKVETRTVIIYDPLNNESTLTFMEFKDKLFNDKFNLIDITKMQTSNEFIVTFEKQYDYTREVKPVPIEPSVPEVIEPTNPEEGTPIEPEGPKEEIPSTDIETPEQLPFEPTEDEIPSQLPTTISKADFPELLANIDKAMASTASTVERMERK